MLPKQWVGVVLVGASMCVLGPAMAMSAAKVDAGGLGRISETALPAQLHLPAGSELVAAGTVELDHGRRTVRMQQVHDDLPVYGRSVVVERGPHGEVLSVKGTLERHLDRELTRTRPRLMPVLARRALQRELGQAEDNVRHAQAQLFIYPGDGTPARLVYRVSYVVGWGDHLARPTALIDADTGEVIKRWNGLAAGNHRPVGMVDHQGE